MRESEDVNMRRAYMYRLIRGSMHIYMHRYMSYPNKQESGVKEFFKYKHRMSA